MHRTRSTRRAFLASTGAVAGALAGCSGTPGRESATPGATLDTLSVTGSPGGTVPVNPPGEVTLLDFFATWCAPCKPQMAHLGTVRDRFPELHMLSITWEDDPGAVESFWIEYDGAWPVALDPDVRTGEAFDVTRIPTLVLIDASGEEAWRHTGLAAAGTVQSQVENALNRADS